jgi:hypothetical protein
MAITKSYLGLEVGDFAGRWKSSALIDQYNPDRRVYFEIELIVRDDRVFGTVTEITEINGSKSPRVFTANRPIREGKVDADFISFTVARSAALGQETVNYTDRYLGVLSGGLIDFTWQSDAPWGAAPQKFTAARQTLPMR